MSEVKKVKALILRDFKEAYRDNGEDMERQFTAGSIVQFTPGEFLNHSHCGLVREPTADEAKSASAAGDVKA